MSIENPISNNENAKENNERRKVSSFETEKGSTYQYLENGKIARHKKATGEDFEMNVAVFIPSWSWFKQNAPEKFIKKFEDNRLEFEEFILGYVQGKHEGKKIFIVDIDGKKIDTTDALDKAEKVFLYFGDEVTTDLMMPVSKEAVLDFLVFDTRKFRDGEEWKRQSHIGNKVVKINYES
ncbi:MAG TPA: hypothetical protein PK950_01715 [Candidatus Paceibacterota bacterium]|nr:hypothetical protein [Candidatus Paceibacterota bacterium]